ncbi:MAG: carbamoyl phosphate synthase small subunit [Clostridia bacterium]
MAKMRRFILENGTECYGQGFGSMQDAICELSFSTAMVGYQEMVTDLSCAGQMVVMTYPLIGNYGVISEDQESRVPLLGGLVVREYNDVPSNFRSTQTLSEMMEEYGIPGISGVDTRMLMRMLRQGGVQKAMITDMQTPKEQVLAAMDAYEAPKDLIARASCHKKWYARTPNHQWQVVAVDCGVKLSLVRKLNACGCNVTVVPYDTPAQMIANLRPDGIILSNGPGNPEAALPVIALVMALACGARTYRMRNAHCGGNHPVRNLRTGKLVITSQGHGYAVDEASLAGTGLEMTYANVLDGTVEGICSQADRFIGVQFAPEGAPGPQDSAYLFEEFIACMAKEGK